MDAEKSWETITQIVSGIKMGWQLMANKYDLKVNISVLPAIACLGFESPNALAYKTLLS